jgi:hypothetical protein
VTHYLFQAVVLGLAKRLLRFTHHVQRTFKALVDNNHGILLPVSAWALLALSRVV